MQMKNKDFEAFSSEYQKADQEILVLTADDSGGAVGFRDSWAALNFFVAYIDIASNELKKGEGRVYWLISKEEKKEHGIAWPYNFKNGSIYRLKVRELIDKTVPEGSSPSFYNCFLLIDILEENVQNEKLYAVLAEYRLKMEKIAKKEAEKEAATAKAYSVKKLKFLKGTLEGDANYCSINIPVAKFKLDGEVVDTSIQLDDIAFTNSFKNLLGKTVKFPVNPNEGYIDGSIYLRSAHNPVDVTAITLIKVSKSKLTLEFDITFNFEFEKIGFSNEKHKIKTELTIE